MPEAPGMPTNSISAEIRDGGAAPPVKMRELLAVVGLVAVVDLTVYRALGFAGPAALFVAAPVLLLAGAPQRRAAAELPIIGALLLVLAAALTWCGSGGQLAIGAALVVAFAMAMAGLGGSLVDLLLFAASALATGGAGLVKQLKALEPVTGLVPRATWFKIILPLAATIVFGTLFVRANPDEAKIFGEWIVRTWSMAWESIWEFIPTGPEYLLWIATAWITGGLLRPLMKKRKFVSRTTTAAGESFRTALLSEAPLYAAFRNTLVALVVLFAAYLVFEFKTLWMRDFPKGFYYAGYAHEGAAWLTAALALATLVLSAIFRPAIFGDARLPRLRRLAWIWSAENLLLALAAYNRMGIYISFNGMTRMRTVGILGITAVLIGFVLVVWKIIERRDFIWLVNRQLWTLAAALYLYAVLPVDALVHAYNVRRIMGGDPAPSVQISVHPIDSGGVLVLHRLLSCEDETIREGIRAMLAQRAVRAEELDRDGAGTNWTRFQLADRLLLKQLRQLESDWAPYADAAKRQAALERYHLYAYQWY